MVSDALWWKLAGGTGLLCPRCIASGLEAMGEFAAYALVDIDALASLRGEVEKLGADLDDDSYGQGYWQACRDVLAILTRSTTEAG
jgi:hypothetical protein